MFACYILSPRGRYQHNAEAESHEQAAQVAVEFMADRFWRGPKPKPGTVLRVVPLYGGEERMVRISGDAAVLR